MRCQHYKQQLNPVSNYCWTFLSTSLAWPFPFPELGMKLVRTSYDTARSMRQPLVLLCTAHLQPARSIAGQGLPGSLQASLAVQSNALLKECVQSWVFPFLIPEKLLSHTAHYLMGLWFNFLQAFYGKTVKMGQPGFTQRDGFKRNCHHHTLWVYWVSICFGQVFWCNLGKLLKI